VEALLPLLLLAGHLRKVGLISLFPEMAQQLLLGGSRLLADAKLEEKLALLALSRALTRRGGSIALLLGVI
jgi:hypothetical protein